MGEKRGRKLEMQRWRCFSIHRSHKKKKGEKRYRCRTRERVGGEEKERHFLSQREERKSSVAAEEILSLY